jgi:LmbE family N-acetylglucosaminyl deacetylase
MHPDEAAPLREAEERAGAREVGVDIVEFLDHRDGVVEGGPPLRRDIVRAIRRHRPEVLISGAFSVRMVGGMTNQADHRVVGLAALDAARDAGNRWIFPELADEGLEPWGGVRYVCFAGAEKPTHGVDVTGTPLERGIASLAAHAEYTKALVPDLDRAHERASDGRRIRRPLRRPRLDPRRPTALGHRLIALSAFGAAIPPA